MNRKLAVMSSIINICSVAAFALLMILGQTYGSYFMSMFIAFSFVIMTCAFTLYCRPEYKVAGYTAMMFAGVYAVIILLIYFAQLTTVRLDTLSAQAEQILDYQKFGLFFSYNLLAYGLMALSTFFIGLTIDVKTKTDKCLKMLLLIHGIFFISGLILPMIGLFSSDMQGANWIGILVLEIWCLYFIPIGILSFLHFKNKA